MRVLYVGTDWFAWRLIEVVPFVVADRAECGPDGACPILNGQGAGHAPRFDAVVVDDRPGEAAPADVVRWLKQQAPDVPIVRLIHPEPDGSEAVAAEYDVEETVEKTGVYRPRLLAALRRVHRTYALSQLNAELRARSAWLHQAVDELSEAVIVLSRFGTVLGASHAALETLGAESISDVLEKPLTFWVGLEHHDDVRSAIGRAAEGEVTEVTLALQSSTGLKPIDATLQALRRGDAPHAGVLVRLAGAPADDGRAAATAAEVEALREALERAETAARLEREKWAEAAEAHAAQRSQWEAGRRELEAQASAALEAATESHRQDRETWEHERATRQVEADELGRKLAACTADLARLTDCDLFGYAVTTADGHLLDCNATFARLLGYSGVDDAIRRAAGRPLPGLAGIEPSRAGAQPAVRADSVTTREGFELLVERWTVALPAAADAPVRLAHVVVDRTREARRDEQLRDARRLGKVGTLTSLMAPDLQTLITSLRKTAGQLDSPPANDASAGNAPADLLANAVRADGLIQQLAAFARRHDQPRSRCGIDDGILRARPMLSRLVGEDVTLDVASGTNSAVRVSQDDLEQMLTSLVVAARDLLPFGGRISIATLVPEPTDWIRAPDALGPIQPVRLEVAAEGYDVLPPAATPALERIVARCDGLLRVRQVDARRVVLDVDLPTACIITST